jgi:hypothetical protein
MHRRGTLDDSAYQQFREACFDKATWLEICQAAGKKWPRSLHGGGGIEAAAIYAEAHSAPGLFSHARWDPGSIEYATFDTSSIRGLVCAATTPCLQTYSLDGDARSQAMQPLYVNWDFQVVSEKKTKFGRFSVTMRCIKTGLLKVVFTYVAQTSVETTATTRRAVRCCQEEVASHANSWRDSYNQKLCNIVQPGIQLVMRLPLHFSDNGDDEAAPECVTVTSTTAFLSAGVLSVKHFEDGPSIECRAADLCLLAEDRKRLGDDDIGVNPRNGASPLFSKM